MMTSEKLSKILAFFDLLYPNAGCELNYSTDYSFLFAVMLSAQTTDKKVNVVTPTIFEKFPTLVSLSKAKQFEVENVIKSIGLYRNKAKFIIDTSVIILRDYEGRVPSSKEALMSLPGVGIKTANVVRAELFKIPEIAVDTHVSRVSKRLKMALATDTVTEIERKLKSILAESRYIKTHHQMIHFGRYFCKAKKPLCYQCQLIEQCAEKNKTLFKK